MPEPIVAEVVCERCRGTGKDPQSGHGSTVRPSEMWDCHGPAGGCGGARRRAATLAPDSLAALKIALAEADLALDIASREYDVFDGLAGPPLSVSVRERFKSAIRARDKALAAVRAHPDYREPGNG